MIVTITKVEQSKSGGFYVCFDDKPDRYYVSKKITPPVVGSVIDAQTSSKRFDGAKYDTWFLNDYKAAEVKSAMQVKQEIASKAVAKPLGGWNIDAGDCARFVSNCIGSAIAAGLVKQPQDMAAWIAAAYRSLQALREGKPIDFDDPVPQWTEPDPSERHDYDDPSPDDEIPF